MELRDEEALAFYLRAVVTFHRMRQGAKGKGDGEDNGDGEPGTGVNDVDDELKK